MIRISLAATFLFLPGCAAFQDAGSSVGSELMDKAPEIAEHALSGNYLYAALIAGGAVSGGLAKWFTNRVKSSPEGSFLGGPSKDTSSTPS